MKQLFYLRRFTSRHRATKNLGTGRNYFIPIFSVRQYVRHQRRGSDSPLNRPFPLSEWTIASQNQASNRVRLSLANFAHNWCLMTRLFMQSTILITFLKQTLGQLHSLVDEQEKEVMKNAKTQKRTFFFYSCLIKTKDCWHTALDFQCLDNTVIIPLMDSTTSNHIAPF